jgi:Flp pilus assembly protein TadG
MSPQPVSSGVHDTTRPRRTTPGRLAGDRGSVAVELAIGMALAVLFVFLLIGTFHIGRAEVDVNAAAAAASRAASLNGSASAAYLAASDGAAADLTGHCTRISVSVDTSQFHRGGAVTVHVGCTVSTRGLIGVRLPGSITVSASSTSPLDLYRAV